MKFFTNKSVVLKIVIALVVVILFNFFWSKPSYATESIGGKLFEPIVNFTVAVGDMIMAVIHNAVFGIEDFLWEIDRSEGWLDKIVNFLPWVAAAAVVVGGVIMALPTGGLSLQFSVAGAVTVIKAVVTVAAAAIGSVTTATKTFMVVKYLTAEMLPENYYLALYSISPKEIFSNSIALLDVNFINPSSASNFDITGGGHPASVLSPIISGWYNILRNITIIGLLLILVYIGIRIIISSTAPEKSKYKETLKDWVIAMCLLFFLHYVMLFSVTAVNKITELLDNSFNNDVAEIVRIPDDYVYDYLKKRGDDQDVDGKNPYLESGVLQIEEATEEKPTGKDGKVVYWPAENFLSQARMRLQNLDENGDLSLVSCGWTLIYLIMVLYTVFFLFTYLKRLLYLAFLTLIAPLVALTYPIDKMNDGKAQAFDMWLKEYIFNLLIQPFHLVLYTVLVGSAMKLAAENPLYAVVAIGFLMPAEKLLRKMFGFEKAQTPGFLGGAMGAGLVMTGMNKLLHHSPKHSGGEGGKDGKIKTKDSIGAGSSDGDSSGDDSLLDDMSGVGLSGNNQGNPPGLNAPNPPGLNAPNPPGLNAPNDPSDGQPQDLEDRVKTGWSNWKNDIGDAYREGYFYSNMLPKMKQTKDNLVNPIKDAYNQGNFNQNVLPRLKASKPVKGAKAVGRLAGKTIKGAKNIGKTVRYNSKLGRGLDALWMRKKAEKQEQVRNMVKNLPKNAINLASGAAVGAAAGILGTAAGISSGQIDNVVKYGGGAAAGGYVLGAKVANGEGVVEDYEKNKDTFQRAYFGEKKYKELQNKKQAEELAQSADVTNKLLDNFTPKQVREIQRDDDRMKAYAEKNITNPRDVAIAAKMEDKLGIDNREKIISAIKYYNDNGHLNSMKSEQKNKYIQTYKDKGYSDDAINNILNINNEVHDWKKKIK